MKGAGMRPDRLAIDAVTGTECLNRSDRADWGQRHRSFPLLWTGALDEMGVMMAGHTLMPLFMLAAMLLRRREYLAHC
jgi:hypothetical protein